MQSSSVSITGGRNIIKMYVKKKWLTDALAQLWRNSHQNKKKFS
jgi:hypothetical protein